VTGSVNPYNKECILLTINCFKKFCMKANTKEANKIYDYYIKMEEIILKYIQNQFIEQQNIIKQKDKALEDTNMKLTKEKELERHNVLLQKYGTVGSLIYIIKVKTNPDNSFIVKIGSSRKGVLDRYNEHKSHYDETIILDCFLLQEERQFELFLHHHKKLRSNKVKDLQNLIKIFIKDFY